MRYACLVLGILGGLTSALCGYLWLTDPEIKAQRELGRALAEAAGETRAVAAYDRIVKASYFLIAALPLGIAGGILALLRKKMSAAVLMLLAVVGPTVLAWTSLLFTCPLLIGGVLCFLIKPRPAVAPAA